MTTPVYTHDSEQPDVDVLRRIDPGPGEKRFLARVKIGDTVGWLWVDSKAELGLGKDDRKTPLVWSFAVGQDSGAPVLLRELSPPEKHTWDNLKPEKP